MTAFQVDQAVWVKTGDKNEETGTILKTGCDPEEMEERIDADEGILVRLHVSAYKLMCAPSQLRPMDTTEASSRPTRRGIAAARAMVTPSPNPSTKSAGKDEEEKKPAAKRKQRNTDDDSGGGAADGDKKMNGTSAATKPKRTKLVVLSRSNSSVSVPQEVAEEPDRDSDEMEQDEDEDSDEEDRPYVIDYAPTGRAACSRCNEYIEKGSLRVANYPLFRSKRGFKVSRHLHCAVFSEEIVEAEDMGGWRKLRKDDYEALVLRVEESKLELEDENRELQPDELVQAQFQGEIRKAAPGLEANLLPFQVEGVSWMYHQEVHVPEIRGGILADEMGMGKTIEAIATILDNRPLLQHSKPGAKHPPSAVDIDRRNTEEALWATSVTEWEHEMQVNNVPKKIWPKKLAAARAGTLIICPLVALSQWKSEIEKFTAPNTLSIGTYHGPNRAAETPAEMIRKYDIVLTTYQVVEQEFRKMVSPNKITCPNCGGKFKIEKLRVHLKYFCGEGAERTEAQARQRRTADSRRDNRDPPSSKKGSSKKKPPMTMEKRKTPPVTATKKSKKTTVQIKRVDSYDSESDFSIEEGAVQTPDSNRRPSRSAAQSASKKLSSSVKEWGANLLRNGDDVDSDDESSFNSGNTSSDEVSEGSGEMEIVLKERRRKIQRRSDEAKDALARAKQKQEAALSAAKFKKMALKKSANKKASKKKGNGKVKGGRNMKKFDSDGSSDESDRESDGDPLEGVDMAALMDEAMAGSRFSVLHSFCFYRVVLDEAHMIKSRSSQTSAACFALTSIHRWCLSGTPLQNRVGELYSLIRFLRIDPMAHYFCRNQGCSCKSIHYRMREGVCLDCGHRAFTHYAHFNKHVLNPIQREGYTGDGRRAMFKLKNEVLDKCLLRRTKETRAADMKLPPRLVSIRYVRLHPIEEDFYEALYTQTKSSFDDYVASGTLLNNYAHIFDLLTRMRQAVDHPYLIVHSKRNSLKKGAATVANGSVDCDMCHEPPTDRILSSCCGAGFCRSCVIEYITGSGGGENTPCPSCQAPFTIDLNQVGTQETVDESTLKVPTVSSSSSAAMPSLKELSHVQTQSILRRINLAEFSTSTKIEVLIEELVEMRKSRPGGKALVFSQFVNMLDLVRWRLHSDPCLSDLGLGVRILHGGMDAKSRDAALKDFREDSSCRVLLMSLKAAGVALNLTVASECYLMDLWWNPAAEMQAIDRCHRLGQHRPIRAVRLVAEGTVEERVLQLQEKKRLVFDGTVGRDAGSLKMLSVEDMTSLFA